MDFDILPVILVFSLIFGSIAYGIMMVVSFIGISDILIQYIIGFGISFVITAYIAWLSTARSEDLYLERMGKI